MRLWQSQAASPTPSASSTCTGGVAERDRSSQRREESGFVRDSHWAYRAEAARPRRTSGPDAALRAVGMMADHAGGEWLDVALGVRLITARVLATAATKKLWASPLCLASAVTGQRRAATSGRSGADYPAVSRSLTAEGCRWWGSGLLRVTPVTRQRSASRRVREGRAGGVEQFTRQRSQVRYLSRPPAQTPSPSALLTRCARRVARRSLMVLAKAL
jgi:hypothetical protein